MRTTLSLPASVAPIPTPATAARASLEWQAATASARGGDSRAGRVRVAGTASDIASLMHHTGAHSRPPSEAPGQTLDLVWEGGQ
mmetsp:Transcript_23338/g.88540  ORF Transcript_23338/g.88540 Transcript_23338/m.88540 type:complete len:84 (+) Transcript_23338:118-369(+)